MAYTGERIDVSTTIQRMNQAAKQEGFACFSMVEQSRSHHSLLHSSGSNQESAPRIYISSGMHGDEPAGPLAVLDLLESEQLCHEIDWTLFPILNPAGLARNQRENLEGVDLNRDYKEPETKEVRGPRRSNRTIGPLGSRSHRSRRLGVRRLLPL